MSGIVAKILSRNIQGRLKLNGDVPSRRRRAGSTPDRSRPPPRRSSAPWAAPSPERGQRYGWDHAPRPVPRPPGGLRAFGPSLRHLRLLSYDLLVLPAQNQHAVDSTLVSCAQCSISVLGFARHLRQASLFLQSTLAKLDRYGNGFDDAIWCSGVIGNPDGRGATRVRSADRQPVLINAKYRPGVSALPQVDTGSALRANPAVRGKGGCVGRERRYSRQRVQHCSPIR